VPLSCRRNASPGAAARVGRLATNTVEPVAGTDPQAEEDALVRALAELRAATKARRKLRPDSPDLLAAVRHEREAMERIWALVEKQDLGKT
jgi:hypothetical protein